MQKYSTGLLPSYYVVRRSFNLIDRANKFDINSLLVELPARPKIFYLAKLRNLYKANAQRRDFYLRIFQFYDDHQSSRDNQLASRSAR